MSSGFMFLVHFPSYISALVQGLHKMFAQQQYIHFRASLPEFIVRDPHRNIITIVNSLQLQKKNFNMHANLCAHIFIH